MAGSIIGGVGDLVGGAVGGLIGGAGQSRAADQFDQSAQAAQQIIQPSPFRANSLFLDTQPNGRAGFTAAGSRARGRAGQLATRTFNRFEQFNPAQFRDRLLRASDRVNDKREGQAFRSLESKLFNRQGASTGTQRQIADFRSDIEDRRFNRALQAEISADQVGAGRFGDFRNAFNLLGNIDDRFLNLQQQSLSGARALAPFGINNPSVAAAGQFRAQNTQDFFRGLGGTVGGAVSAGISLAANPFTPGANSSGGGEGFFNANAINFGNNPFSTFGAA